MDSSYLPYNRAAAGLLQAVAILSTALLLSCDNVGRSHNGHSGNAERFASERLDFTVDTLYSRLENPWGIAWLPDGRMLVTERSGEIWVFENERHTGRKLSGFPDTYARGQGGLMDIQLHPAYIDNGWIYVTYAKPGVDGGGTALVRFQLEGNGISNLQTLYETSPFSTSGVHFGSRIVFDKAGYVYFSTGERGTKENAQHLSNDLGKIHRLHDDGRIPADNPFMDSVNAKHSIWSFGHRNVQGMAYDPTNDIIYATEHGPRGGDELNVIEKGKNYGWPSITYGIDYSGAIISAHTEMEGMEQPVHYWTPSIGACGLLFYHGDRFPEWKNNLFAGALALSHIERIELSNGRYIHGEKLLPDIGRIRCVAQSPDGFIVVLTEDPGMVLRLVPAE